MNRAKQYTHAALGVEAGAFVFCERSTGAIRFQVSPTSDGELPIEEAASLLAMHCLVRARKPADFMVLVVPQQEMLGPVGRRAELLLSAGREAVGANIPLSARQREVLGYVLQDLSNKEISSQLNVAERTVKFHVSQLLAKFKAHNRASLKQRAAAGMLPVSDIPGDTLFGFAVPPQAAEQANENGSRAARLLDIGAGRTGQSRST